SEQVGHGLRCEDRVFLNSQDLLLGKLRGRGQFHACGSPLLENTGLERNITEKALRTEWGVPSNYSVAISMTKRYRTSLLSTRSYASLTLCTGMTSTSDAMPCLPQKSSIS